MASGGKLIQTDVVFDVLRNDCTVFRGDRLEVPGGEHRVRREVGQVAGLDDVADGVAGGVGLEVSLQRVDCEGRMRVRSRFTRRWCKNWAG